jgi:hypothetical protein
MSDETPKPWRVIVEKIKDTETVELVVEQRFDTEEQAEDSVRFLQRMYRPPGFRMRVVGP